MPHLNRAIPHKRRKTGVCFRNHPVLVTIKSLIDKASRIYILVVWPTTLTIWHFSQKQYFVLEKSCEYYAESFLCLNINIFTENCSTWIFLPETESQDWELKPAILGLERLVQEDLMSSRPTRAKGDFQARPGYSVRFCPKIPSTRKKK